ncbi:glycosyltransferase family 4 protein [Rhodoplanes sp. TEM]|uniref:Glycosyltransferase family 4 protein n=1 Tax=Rhodoplanes tepidamans TaxID=200616 RepID=A0ABT5JCD2_RHOTP|nr:MULTISPECIES: glycosyltransferase family 4 protein [Rhodoplanes]MDC7786710.1 glycosyltransferase family 4 protein [Rhodoplanes tepidamans]MDC7983716.1 glycosyltransferase family 4 protein [Rhodoplanes sp. TEM]MDQ0358146.1 glycosyltransferase involved in cell wall biosynthesis [Rhodoplanes tepidamans]
MKRSRAMPIALVAPFAPPLTGQTAYSAHLRDLLGPAGVEVLALPGRDDRDGLRGYRDKLLAAIGVMGRLLRGPRREAMVVVLDGGLGLLLDAACVLVARLRGTRTIALSHHSFAYVNRGSLPMRLLVMAAPRRRTVHLFLCGAMRDGFVARYGEVRSHILPNAAAVATGPVPGVRDAARFRLGYLSNITFEKGIRGCIALVEALLARGADVEAVIAGPAGSDAVAAYLDAAAARFPGRITWIGPVYGADKDRFLSGLSLLVFPTDYVNEAQPTVLLEALAHGVPVATVARGCIAGDMAGSGSLVARSAAIFVDEAVPFALSLLDRHRAGGQGAVAAAAAARFAAIRAAARDAEAGLLALLRGEDADLPAPPPGAGTAE